MCIFQMLFFFLQFQAGSKIRNIEVFDFDRINSNLQMHLTEIYYARCYYYCSSCRHHVCYQNCNNYFYHNDKNHFDWVLLLITLATTVTCYNGTITATTAAILRKLPSTCIEAATSIVVWEMLSSCNHRYYHGDRNGRIRVTILRIVLANTSSY